MAVVSALDLAIGFYKKSMLYDSLQRRFSDLLVKMITVKAINATLLKEWQAERVLIEKDEPTKLKALEMQCRNEEVIAQDRLDQIYKISLNKKLLKHYWSFDAWQPVKN